MLRAAVVAFLVLAAAPGTAQVPIPPPWPA
jgi:hypothetical protein